MKKLISAALAALLLLSLCACSGNKPQPPVEKDSYNVLLDASLKLVTDFDRETLDKVLYRSQIEYMIQDYASKDKDYIAALEEEFASVAAAYTEAYGEDWKLSYTINETIEKDAEGIEKYKEFDSFYFKTYGIDTDKIQAVTFLKVTAHIAGSLGSNSKDRTIQCFMIDGAWYSFYAIRLGLKL